MFAMAFAVGANNIAKVVATLVSSGISSYKKAIIFGTICSALGALAAIILGIAIAVTLTEGDHNSHAESVWTNRIPPLRHLLSGAMLSDASGNKDPGYADCYHPCHSRCNYRARGPFSS